MTEVQKHQSKVKAKQKKGQKLLKTTKRHNMTIKDTKYKKTLNNYKVTQVDSHG